MGRGQEAEGLVQVLHPTVKGLHMLQSQLQRRMQRTQFSWWSALAACAGVIRQRAGAPAVCSRVINHGSVEGCNRPFQACLAHRLATADRPGDQHAFGGPATAGKIWQ